MVYVRKNDIRQFINSLDLKDGERHRCDCPAPDCRGKNTFTVANIFGELKYNCFKLGCRVGGIYDTGMTAAEIFLRMNEQQFQRAYTNIKKS